MKTIELEIAMMGELNIRANLIVPNISWGMPGLYYEADLVRLTKAGWATEYELKVSRQDIKRDKEKRWEHNSKLFRELYFVVPKGLEEYALKHVPERAGLYVVSKSDDYGYVVEKLRGSKINKNAIKWDDKRRYQLARLGAMRIRGLKKKIFKLMNEAKNRN